MKNIAIFLFSLLLFKSYTDAHAATYEIRVRNKTSQTLTTAVCAIHTKSASIFTPGEPASEGLASLAEDGVAGTFFSETEAIDGVLKARRGSFISPSGKDTITISAGKRGRRLSCVLGMLVATNDAFPAFRSRRLPRRVGQRVRFRAFAYDAGSEVNTESCDHVPGGPCDAHFVGEDENGTVQRHPGIQGGADLSVSSHGWTEPAVRGTIVRTR